MSSCCTCSCQHPKHNLVLSPIYTCRYIHSEYKRKLIWWLTCCSMKRKQFVGGHMTPTCCGIPTIFEWSRQKNPAGRPSKCCFFQFRFDNNVHKRCIYLFTLFNIWKINLIFNVKMQRYICSTPFFLVHIVNGG